MKKSLRVYYDAALNKTEISDPYFQGMWNEAMRSVRVLGDEILVLEQEQEKLGEKLGVLSNRACELEDALRFLHGTHPNPKLCANTVDQLFHKLFPEEKKL